MFLGGVIVLMKATGIPNCKFHWRPELMLWTCRYMYMSNNGACAGMVFGHRWRGLLPIYRISNVFCILWESSIYDEEMALVALLYPDKV